MRFSRWPLLSLRQCERVVFSAQPRDLPRDLPAALAPAREAKTSIERCTFAATYAKAVEQRNQNTYFHKGHDRGQEKIPIFSKNKIKIKIMIIGADRTTGRIR